MTTIRGIAVFGLLLATSSHCFAQTALEPSIASSWTTLKSSWFGVAFRVKCGGSFYEIEKPMFGTTSIKWLDQDGNWFPLTIAKASDEAITFDGLGRQTSNLGILLSNKDPKVVEVLRRPSNAHKDLGIVSVMASDDVFVQFQYKMNFATAELAGSNTDTILANVEVGIDSEKIGDLVVDPHSVRREFQCEMAK